MACGGRFAYGRTPSQQRLIFTDVVGPLLSTFIFLEKIGLERNKSLATDTFDRTDYEF